MCIRDNFKKLGKKSFSVTRSNAVNALDDAETVLNETEAVSYTHLLMNKNARSIESVSCGL